MTIRDLLRQRKRDPLRAYDKLETIARDHAQGFRAIVDDVLANGYTLAGSNIPSVLPPVDWSAHNRSYSFHLHAWDAIGDLLLGYDAFGDERCLSASLAHAGAWLAEFQRPRLGQDSPEDLDRLYTPAMLPEWYDMAVGTRAYRIAYLLDVLIRRDASDDEIEFWWQSLQFHLKLLGRDSFFKVHTNHGLYQALGHLAAARRYFEIPGMSQEYELARDRTLRVLAQHFTEEGPHKEHSPGYHYMLMGTLMNARRCGLLDDGTLAQRMDSIEAALPYMVMPNFNLVTFGDTDPRLLVRGETIAGLHRDPTLQYVISGGKLGTAPAPGVKLYRAAGYAFARLYAEDVEPVPSNASYLAQIAAFHSRVHKHADHLGFVWYDRGRDILIDPARYAYAGRTAPGSELFNQGFWYADPKRIYVESTRAHNCVEIDATSYPRRSAVPFGSAIRYAGEQDGMAVTDCEATHFRTIRHRRVLVMRPGHFLLVLDWLYDRANAHDYRQWFQFDSGWNVQRAGNSWRSHAQTAGQRQQANVTVIGLIDDNAPANPISGQTEPQLQGWTSDAPYSLIPSTSICLAAPRGGLARFATLFVLEADATPNRQATRFNATLKTGRAVWQDRRGAHTLAIELGEAGNAAASFTSVTQQA